MKKLLKSALLLSLTIISFTPTLGNAKDVSSEITMSNSGLILGCITRLQIYADRTQNIMEMPDKNFSKNQAHQTIEISIPYMKNIRDAAWSKYPGKDWNAFYKQQNELVELHLETTNSWYDAMTCTQQLLTIGVFYPVVKDPSKMPPEQRAIFMKIMQRKMKQK